MNPSPIFSEDRRWWWDGSGWNPAVSADGQQWFDGQAWHSFVASRVQRPDEARRAVGWALLVLGSVFAAAGLISLPWSSASSTRALVVSLVAAGVALVGRGLLRDWPGVWVMAIVVLLALAGLGVGALVAMWSDPDPPATDGNGYTALGLVFWIPVLIFGAASLIVERCRRVRSHRSNDGHSPASSAA